MILVRKWTAGIRRDDQCGLGLSVYVGPQWGNGRSVTLYAYVGPWKLWVGRGIYRQRRPRRRRAEASHASP